MNVNFKLLQTFILAAESGSFRKAAAELNRSPSAVSMQIRDLEEQIGVSLFIRTPQRAVATKEGHVLLDQVKRAVQDVQFGLEQLAGIANVRRSRVRIACSPTIAATRLPNILAHFRRRSPHVNVEIVETPSSSLLELVRAQEVEFGIGPAVPNMADFDFETMAEDYLVACVPANLDDGRSRFPLDAFISMPAIILSSNNAIRGTIEKLFSEKGITLDVQYEVQQASTALALAAAGLGVAILPSIVAPHAFALQLRLAPLEDAKAYRRIGIISLRGYVHKGITDTLRDSIRIVLSRLNEDIHS